MMNIVICDDDKNIIEEVAAVCKECLSESVSIYAFQSAESLLQNLTNEDYVIDLFILDIEMPGKNGFWLKQELERYRYGSSIIYLTSHDELVQDAFGRYVIGFVDKVSFHKDKNKLIEILKNFEEMEQKREAIYIRDESGSFYIQKDCIIMVTSEHVYTYLKYATGKIVDGHIMIENKLVRKSLREWESELGDNFLRVGKSCIVNMDYILRIDRTMLLKDGTTLNIPRANLNKCQDSYFEFCKRRMKWK